MRRERGGLIDLSVVPNIFYWLFHALMTLDTIQLNQRLTPIPLNKHQSAKGNKNKAQDQDVKYLSHIKMKSKET